MHTKNLENRSKIECFMGQNAIVRTSMATTVPGNRRLQLASERCFRQSSLFKSALFIYLNLKRSSVMSHITNSWVRYMGI